MRRAVRMAAPCTDRGTIWFCFQVLIHVHRCAPYTLPHDESGPRRRGRPMCLPSPLPPETEWLRHGERLPLTRCSVCNIIYSWQRLERGQATRSEHFILRDRSSK